MKWIGQNIYDLIARFRNDVYLEDISTGTIASGAHLGLDSNNKIVKAVDGGGDLTSIVAGTGLSGTSLTGPIPTLNVDASIPSITTLAGLTSFGSASATCSFLGTDFSLANAGTNKPTVSLFSYSDNSAGGHIFFFKQRLDSGVIQVGEDNDDLGTISFIGYNDGTPANKTYASISSDIHDATTGEESGRLTFQVANEDGGLGSGLILTGGSANNEIDVTLGLGTASVTTVAGTLTMGSTAAMTNAGLLSVANQSNITGVGTIGTGVWQGTTIKTAYIGDDQVTEDKLANTLLAEIDANTAKVTNVTTNLTGTTSENAFRVNCSDGTNVIIAEASGTIAGVMTVIHHDKLDGIETSATADQSKSDIDGLAITTVGTIDTGVWNGTKITDIYTNSSGKRYGNTIKILPSDFMINDDAASPLSFKDGSNSGVHVNDAASEAIAFVTIPEGMTATLVDVYGTHNKTLKVWEVNVHESFDFTGSTIGTGALNTQLNITDTDATEDNYLAIQVTLTATSQRIWGGRVTIAPQ